MKGKDILNNCSQNVKDIIVENFGSLDNFYAYTYQIGVEQYISFMKNKNIDSGKEDRLKTFLEVKGLDYFAAEDLVREIISDYDQTVADNYAQELLGPDWKKKLAEFEKIVDL